MAVNAALIGKAGELLVAAELMRRGVEVAHPASDVGVDLLAYRLVPKQPSARTFVPIQVKARSGFGYHFQRTWFTRVPGVVLVYVWNMATIPEFYVLDSLESVAAALGEVHGASKSWVSDGIYNVTNPNQKALERMHPHKDRWDRVLDRLPS